ncbi:MAG: glycosyltransferase family 4 protein [Patescibacteria group bacterium]
MKIIVFAGYFYPHKGGYENYIYELHKHLHLKQLSVDVVTCNTNNSKREETIDGINIYRFDCWNILGGTYSIPILNRNFFYTWKKIKETNYNFVNTQTRFFLTSLMGLIFAKIKKIRLIHTEHGTKHSVLSNQMVSLISKIYDHTLGYLVIRCADYNFVVSQSAGEFSKHLGAKKFQVIHNGVDAHKFRRTTTDLKSRLCIKDEYKIVTFIGRMIEAKGVQDLISVINEIGNHIKIKLLLVGDGKFKDALVNMAIENKNIIFLGEKNQEEIVNILSITDVFVNPSYSEGLPTSVLEAGACSCAVVASDVGGTNEIIENEINGFLVKPHDLIMLRQRINELLFKPQIAVSFGKQLNEKINTNFNWSSIRAKYIDVLESL